MEQERVEDLMNRFGYSEKEARAALHLESAEKLLREVFVKEGSGASLLLWTANYGQHFRAIEGFLAKQSASRAYPEGWGRKQGQEEG